MPFNGSGTFQRIYSWVADAANGIFVSSSRTDTDTNDIANGLSNCVTRDGQSPPTANLPMGGFKLTGLAAGSANGESVRYEQLSSILPFGLCEGRLTLTTGVPVTTSDVLAAETLYFTPFMGNRVALYSSGAWEALTFSEISIDVPDVTGVHDVFIYNNAGLATLEVLVWTNDTTRATALTTQNGVLVKSGDATRRYLGTFYSTTAGNGQTEDSNANRYLWNYYNRVVKPFRNPIETTNAWNYTTATIRQANANTANQVNFVIGIDDNTIKSQVVCKAFNSGGAANFAVTIGLDSTSAAATGVLTNGGGFGSTTPYGLNAILETFIGAVGKHYLAWLEWSTAAGTTTFYGDDSAGMAAGTYQGGISGWLQC